MKIRLSGTLLRFADFRSEVEIQDEKTIRSALLSLSQHYPKLKPILFAADTNSLRPVHRIFVSGKMVEPQDIDKPLNPSDDIEILTAIAGG